MLPLHKAESNCRVCKHPFNHHCIYIKLEQGGLQQQFVLPVEMVPCDSYLAFGHGSLDVTGKCGCLDWQPMDNLEFLELKAKQQDEKTFD